MKKILQSEWGHGLYQGILYGIEVLLLFGISVKLTAFTMGITSGWVGLFTYMLMGGAVCFPFLLNLINRKQKINPEIQKHTILIRIILYALITCFMDIRIALLTVLVHGVLYFLGNKELLRPAVFCFALCMGCYGYTKGWITMADCMILTLAENGIFSDDTDLDTDSMPKKGYAYDSLWKIDHGLILSVIVMCVLKCIQYACVMISLALLKDAVIQINDLQELFQYKNTFFCWMILCMIHMLSIYLAHKVQKKMMGKDPEEDTMVRLFHASYIPERTAFALIMPACGLTFMNKSGILCICMILMCVSFMLMEILMGNGKHTTWIILRNIRTFMIRLFLIIWLVIVQTVYDGIFVDYSVVIMSAFLFYGIVQCTDTWKKNDALLDGLLSEEV